MTDVYQNSTKVVGSRMSKTPFLSAFRAIIATVFFTISNFASATLIEYNFEFELNGSTYLTGNFTAEDLDLNGFINDEELINLNFSNAFYATNNYVFNAAIQDNFNFDILTNEFILGGNSFSDTGQRWNASGTGFGFEAGNACAGFDLDGSFQNCDARPATDIVQTTYLVAPPATSVPEPTSIAILALGILGLASRRFKK